MLKSGREKVRHREIGNRVASHRLLRRKRLVGKERLDRFDDPRCGVAVAVGLAAVRSINPTTPSGNHTSAARLRKWLGYSLRHPPCLPPDSPALIAVNVR